MAPVWSKQPFKAIFIVFHGFQALVMVPWLLVRNAPKSARPFPEWSLKLCVVNALSRQLLLYQTQTRSNSMSDVLTDQKKAGERHALAKPAQADLYSGILASGVAKPAEVGGLWYPAPPREALPDVGNERVVLHFPGGAFVLAFGLEMYGKAVSAAISKYLKVPRTFFAQYRLAADAETRFPAALQDIVTFYNYILSLGYKPDNIIVSGDSAAGNLIIALLRYLEDSNSLPLPAGAMVWSPWVHVTSHAGADYKACRNSATDCLVPTLLQWGAEAYYPEHQPTAEEVAYISPLHHPYRTRVPLFIQAGTTEAFFDTIGEFATEMDKVDGSRVRFHRTDFGTHDLILTYDGVGLEGKVESALRDASGFFEQ